MPQILILLFFYFLILYSILGYGRIFTLINSNYQASSFDGLLGIAILILLSYSSNIFFPHNYLHNSIIIFFGIFIFIYDLIKNFSIRIFEYKELTFLFFLIFIGILLYKNHDDFYYYHFPYTLILTDFEKIFGLGNLNHAFRTPSSIFYLNSLFYLPGIKYFLMNGGAIYILGFSNFIIYRNIKDQIKAKKIDYIFFLSLLSLVYINSSFARIAEHGTDRSALILIFVMAIYYLKSLEFDKDINIYSHLKSYYSKLTILFTIIITLKVFYLIYFVFFLLWFLQVKKFLNLNNFSILVFKNYYSYLGILSFMFCIFTIFSNSGCFIYPASFTCLENYSWSVPVSEAKQMHLWFEQWSKAGAGPTFRIENPEIYVSKFNWVENWLNFYFFNKVSDNILLIILISVLIFFLLSFNSIKKVKIDKAKANIKFFYILVLFLFFEWFYNHPSLRYGGYTLLALIFFIPVSLFLGNFNYDMSKLKKKIFFLFILTSIIFISRNVYRINYEIDKYDYNPINKAFFHLNKDGFIINGKVKTKYKNWKLKNKSFLIIERE